MRKISIWAKNNPWTSRILIVSFFVMLTGLGLLTGILLRELSINLAYSWMYVTGGLYLSGILYYPLARNKRCNAPGRSTYNRQKSCDLLLAATTFLLIAFVSNRPETLFSNTGNLYATVAPPLGSDSAGKTYLDGKGFSKVVRNQDGKLLKWKERKKLLKNQVKAIKKAKDLSKGAKVTLIILSVIIAMGLAYGVAVLACNISCSGSEAAAIVVFIGGLALLGFLLVLAIRGILGKKPRKKQETEERPGSPG